MRKGVKEGKGGCALSLISLPCLQRVNGGGQVQGVRSLLKNRVFFLLGKSLGILHGHLANASEDSPRSGDPDLSYSG